MILVELADDDLDKNGQFVRIGKVAAAIARASGANNLLNTERKVSAAVNAGIQTKALNPIDPETLTPLSRNDWGNGIVTFDELAKWGQAGGLFRFWRASDGRPRTLTKAPPPISPTRGSGQTRLRTTVAAPDWTFWPASRPVREWQGIALSLNFEPWANEPSNFFSHYFPDANTEATFKKRKAMFLDFFPSNERMLLSAFAEWAVSVAKWESLPPELVAMVQTSDKKVPASTSKIVGAGETAAGTAGKAKGKQGGDRLTRAMIAAYDRLMKKHGTQPTCRALFDWLKDNDDTGAVEAFEDDALTFRRGDGGLKDVTFEAFTDRFSRLPQRKKPH